MPHCPRLGRNWGRMGLPSRWKFARAREVRPFSARVQLICLAARLRAGSVRQKTARRVSKAGGVPVGACTHPVGPSRVEPRARLGRAREVIAAPHTRWSDSAAARARAIAPVPFCARWFGVSRSETGQIIRGAGRVGLRRGLVKWYDFARARPSFFSWFHNYHDERQRPPDHVGRFDLLPQQPASR